MASPSQLRAHGIGFWLWLTCASLLLIFFSFFLGAWAVRHATIGDGNSRFSEQQVEIILYIADFPWYARNAIEELWSQRKGEAAPQLMERKVVERPEWQRHFPAPEDSGYLLFSGIDPIAGKTVIKLIRVADGTIMGRWFPDADRINDHITGNNAPKVNWRHLRAQHPLLLDDGDIIYNTSFLLVRQKPCDTRPVWVLDETMHHSNEMDVSGKAFWVGAVARDSFPENSWLRDKIRDDALALVSLDGKLLEKRSILKILKDNGLEAIALGTSGLQTPTDPIHVNQIRVARIDSRYWKRGDLLVSARNISTVFLYRPSTNKIIWYRIGPWLNQHSANFIDDHRISVFNNNVVSGPEEEGQKLFLNPQETSQVQVYDFDTDKVSRPFQKLLASVRLRSVTEGRARVLPDGGLYIEETNYGRHLRFTKDKLLWSRVNDYDEEHVGMVSWSRYLTADEARIPLQALVSLQCKPQQ
ncbi:MAG: arylsulfotransferase family protein [Gallionella sp.]|nr:arylsulfotransferase family protein [Gallionella sp.]MDD4946731.1 arylsulfotransferase family protein [Gallionella sp.]